jgi:DNA-binding ferritin-like protein (Dps family)
MKSSEVAELKRRSVTSEKNHADSLQAELRTTRNKLDKYLENSVKQEQDTKMLLMKVLTSLQVAAVKDSNKLEYKAQSQQMQRRNEKERFTGL